MLIPIGPIVATIIGALGSLAANTVGDKAGNAIQNLST